MEERGHEGVKERSENDGRGKGIAEMNEEGSRTELRKQRKRRKTETEREEGEKVTRTDQGRS